jgi:predicted ATPase/class 3 adenylate cyclase/tetratricopeptide (TPR) repeat protein
VATEAADTADTTPKPLLRALLLTDAIDSTKLTQALGDAAMAQHWAVHDRAARDLLPAWRGREIDKTDGMLLLFERAEDAVGYAMAYHRALAATSLPFKARAGIHVGEVVLRANPADDVARGAKPVEVDGIALPVTARVMSVALGGQTLMTGDARIALGITKLRLQTHGHWRLHGLADPMELFEVGDKDAPFTPPHDEAKAYRVARIGDLWQPVREVKHSVPAERDSFVGRQEPLQVLAKKLEGGARLVSVLGMGGTGKTRLVTRFAWMWLGEFPGGVWFCDLSQARTVDGIYFAVAQGLDVPLGKTDPVVQLGHAINGRGKCLVILDNFEQVARHAEDTLGRWLERAPQASFIVTSREVLGIVGEQTLVLDPLPVADAAALFLRRAESARQDYRPSTDDRVAIEQLVKVLDGLPLAIELAAARVRVMAPRTLLARMNERFGVLLSRTGRLDRQMTLRATLDWSWELFSDAERAGLAQLSVFEGGFTLESAERVLDLSAIPDAPRPSDVIQWLVDKSFVRPLPGERFDLLESVRAYASEHLRTEGRFPNSGDSACLATQRRHEEFFAHQSPGNSGQWLNAELDNLVAACRRAAGRGDGPVAIRTLSGAWGPIRLCGPFRVALELATLVWKCTASLTASEIAELALISGGASELSGAILQAEQHLLAAESGARKTGNADIECRAVSTLAGIQAHQGRLAEAEASYRRAVSMARSLSDRGLECGVLNHFGSHCEAHGRLDEARECYEEALLLARKFHDRRWEGGSAGNLAQFYANQGLLPQAKVLYEQAVEIARQLGDRQWEANTRCNLGLLHLAQDDAAAAQAELVAALLTARDLGHVRLLATVQCNLGLVAEALGHPDDAYQSYCEAVAIAGDLGDRRSEGQFLGYLGLLQARQAEFDSARQSLQRGAQLLEAMSDRVSMGILLCNAAQAEHLAGNPAAAEEFLSRATAVVATLPGLSESSELGQSLKLASQQLMASKV